MPPPAKKKSERKSVVIDMARMEDDRRRVPPRVEEQFGKIGFVKWTNTYCPVLCVNPFDLFASGNLPAGIYHAWMYKIDTPTATKELPLLLYWYGTNWEFSVVAASNLLPYEEAKELGFHQVPKFVQERSELKRSLPADFALLQEGLKQVKPHLALKPQERHLTLPLDDDDDDNTINDIVLNEWHTLSMAPPSPFHQTFLRKKRSVELKFPPHLSQHFGRLAFSKFGKSSKKGGRAGPNNHYHPVLVLNPFRVPPGPIRVEWFHRYAQQPSFTTLIVYWLGAMTCGHKNVIDSAFSFCSSSSLMDYEQGVAKGYQHVEEAVLKKYQQKRVSFTVDWRICGQWELEQALQKVPEERWGGLEDFEEDYTDDFDYYLECVNQGNEQQKQLIAQAKPKFNGNGNASAAPPNEDRQRDIARNLEETTQIIDQEEPTISAEEETSNSTNNQEDENPLGVVEPPMHDVEEGPLEGYDFNNSNPNAKQIGEAAAASPKKKNNNQKENIAGGIDNMVNDVDHPSSAATTPNSSDSSSSGPPPKQNGRYVSCNDDEDGEPAESKHLFQDTDSDKSDNGKGKESAASSDNIDIDIQHKKSPSEQEAGSETESEEEDYNKKGESSAQIPQDESPDDAEEQVWNSIHACADVLHQETARIDTRKRKYSNCPNQTQNRNQNRNRRLQVASLPRASDEKVKPNVLHSDASDRLHELKRRKLETQQVVSKVIEEWTQKKKRTPHHKYL
jgi:hypothetical protein